MRSSETRVKETRIIGDNCERKEKVVKIKVCEVSGGKRVCKC